MNNIVTTIQEQNLEPTEVQKIASVFEPFVKMADDLVKKAQAIQVTSVEDTQGMKAARELRLELKGIRVDVEKKRKAMKEESLRKGKAIDGVANVIKFIIEPQEEHLEKQEKYALELERKRLEELVEKRKRELEPYGVDTQFMSLGDMPQDVYDKLLENSKYAHEARIQAEKDAEAERIRLEEEKRAENERIRAENERLQKENAAKAAEIEKQRVAKAEAERKEREAAEAEAKKKLELELAPDKEKLKAFAKAVIAIEKPVVTTQKANKVIIAAERKLEELSELILSAINQL